MYKRPCYVQQASKVLDMGFQENLSNRRWDMAEKVPCLLSKVPFITDRLQPNLHVM
jgi:hypothetical protein